MTIYINDVVLNWTYPDSSSPPYVGYELAYYGNGKSDVVSCRKFANSYHASGNEAEMMREHVAEDAGCSKNEVFFAENCVVRIYEDGTFVFDEIAGNLEFNEYRNSFLGETNIDKVSNAICNSIMADTFDRRNTYDQGASQNYTTTSYVSSGSSYITRGSIKDTIYEIVGLLIFLLIIIWFLDAIGVFSFLKKVWLIVLAILKWVLIIAAVIGIIWLIMEIIERIQ